MGEKTAIEWADSTWNPVTGCDEVSPGCDRCYAKTLAERFRDVKDHYFEDGFDVVLRPDKMDEYLVKSRPRRVFVNSMSDVFHSKIPREYLAEMFARMALSPQHTYQILTKRSGVMKSVMNSITFREMVARACTKLLAERLYVVEGWYDMQTSRGKILSPPWPLPNVWMGVSVEDQDRTVRIRDLANTPAAVRFLSCEPLLGALYFDLGLHSMLDEIDWVIVGGESGHGARPMHPDWVRRIREQCDHAGVPFLFKQWGNWSPDPSVRSEPDGLVTWDGKVIREGDETWFVEGIGAVPMAEVGKKKAGRTLDGRTWDEYPEG